MIRFRLGQSWTRERTGWPVDSIGLEIDGLELLPGASEEPLLEVVPELAEAVHRLARGKSNAQVSFAEAHLELVLHRVGDEAELRVASLGRPACLIRPPSRVELSALVEATARCAEALLADLPDRKHSGATRLQKAASGLGRRPRALVPPQKSPGAYSHRVIPHANGTFGFWLWDLDGRLASWTATQPPLAPLLGEGELVARLGPSSEGLWRARGVPYLFAFELARQAAELREAIEQSERRFTFRPGGLGEEITCDLSEGTARWGDERFALPASELLRGMLELGPSLVFALAHRRRALARNPHLVALAQKCGEERAELRAPRSTRPGPREAEVAGSGRRSPRARGKKSVDARPLHPHGRLRRLRFEKKWEHAALPTDATGSGRGAMRLGDKGPIVVGAEVAQGFFPDGSSWFRREGAHGVAVAPDGWAITASESRVEGFIGAEPSARWMHDHDGLPLGPWLLASGHVLVTCSDLRTAVAFDSITGRELWRIAPPRTQKLHLSTLGDSVWLATDGGLLLAVDPLEGQLQARIRAPLPFTAPVRPLSRGPFALLGRGESCALIALDSKASEVLWTAELSLARATAQVHGGRILVAGLHEGEGRLIALTAGGSRRFERALPLGKGPYAMAPAGKSVLVVDRTGAAVQVSTEGKLEWRLGSAGDALSWPVSPVLARQVALIPGPVVRAVNPKDGALLAEVAAGPTLCDLQANANLDVFSLDEDGRLSAHHLTTHLAVVGGASAEPESADQ